MFSSNAMQRSMSLCVARRCRWMSSYPRMWLQCWHDRGSWLVKLSPDGRYFLPAGASWSRCTLRETRMYEVTTGRPASPPLAQGGHPGRRHFCRRTSGGHGLLSESTNDRADNQAAWKASLQKMGPVRFHLASRRLTGLAKLGRIGLRAGKCGIVIIGRTKAEGESHGVKCPRGWRS